MSCTINIERKTKFKKIQKHSVPKTFFIIIVDINQSSKLLLIPNDYNKKNNMRL